MSRASRPRYWPFWRVRGILVGGLASSGLPASSRWLPVGSMAIGSGRDVMVRVRHSRTDLHVIVVADMVLQHGRRAG
jgi:hypothetical protein